MAAKVATLIFDGDCGFCTSSARWLQRRLPLEVRVLPWQGQDLARLGLSQDDVMTAAYWIDAEGRAWRGHRGVARALVAVGGGWRLLGAFIDLPPLRPLAAIGYRLVARYRYRLPGSTPACRTSSDRS